MNSELAGTHAELAPIQVLEAFSARLPRGAHVLCVPGPAAQWLAQRGVEVQLLPPEKDPRLLSLKRESFDGIWAGPAFESFPIEEAQRVIASFFQALVPAKGVLFATHRYAEAGFASLLRQNGFKTLLQAENRDQWMFVANRI